MFFIFLYQRYIYKEDKSRVNEFGFSGDMLDEKDGSSQGGEEIAVENKEDEEEEEQSAVTENSQADSSGAWKNTQKQKSKKSKKMD